MGSGMRQPINLIVELAPKMAAHPKPQRRLHVVPLSHLIRHNLSNAGQTHRLREVSYHHAITFTLEFFNERVSSSKAWHFFGVVLEVPVEVIMGVPAHRGAVSGKLRAEHFGRLRRRIDTAMTQNEGGLDRI